MPRLAEQSSSIQSNDNLSGFLFFGGSHERNKEAFNAAPDDQVTVFFDAGFNGKSMSFPPGAFKLFGKKNRDEISSIKVPKGLKLEVWTGGPPSHPDLGPDSNPRKKKEFTSSVAYVGDELNDKIDTLRVSIYASAKEQQTGFDFGGDESSTTTNGEPESTTTAPDNTQSSNGQPDTTQPEPPGQDNTLMYAIIGVGAVTAIGSAVLLTRN